MSKLMLSLPNSGDVRIPLEADGVVGIRDAAGSTLEAICGRAWVTFQGDRTDYLLTPGKRLSLTGRGAVVAQALGYAELKVASEPTKAEATKWPDQAVTHWRDQSLHLAPYVSLERTF
jgi:hypothetical protein